MNNFQNSWEQVNQMTTIQQLETILNFLTSGGTINELVLRCESIPTVCHEVIMAKK
jgi:hypothetical protein